jgi:CheY-like chemotaxis protein
VTRQFDLALVIDDDPDIALAARLALRDIFERIETLTSPAEALERMDRERPDAILLDLNTPKSDGFEVPSSSSSRRASRKCPSPS